MASSIQARVANLISDNNSRKVAAKIAGSLVPFREIESKIFSYTMVNNEYHAQKTVQFVPTSTSDGYSSTRLFANGSITQDFSNFLTRLPTQQLPQIGDGACKVKLDFQYAAGTTVYFKVTAIGSSSGEFSVL